MNERWKSRKFIVTVATQVAALAVMLLSALGYVTAEASVDRARAPGEPGVHGTVES
jgi:hypothetical protein